MAGPYSMVGYYDARSPRPFLTADVTADAARKEAAAEDLESYLLLPHGPPHQHRAYVRRASGVYEQTHTRLFVFKHLLDTDCLWIPTPAEVEAGKKSTGG